MRILPNSGRLQPQERSNWCWAASASHVADCLSAYVEQCDVAQKCLNICHGECEDPHCDTAHYLHDALDKLAHFKRWQPARASQSVVQAEIKQKRPVGVRIDWGNGTGHFILIVGAGLNRRPPHSLQYVLFDPAEGVGLQVIGANRLETGRYLEVGHWSETIFTK